MYHQLLFIFVWLLFGTHHPIKSSTQYETWTRQRLDVYIMDNHELRVKLRNGQTRNLVEFEADEKRDHPCKYRDGYRAAPGTNICIYHKR